jgi:hypothetical protein
MHVYLHGKRLLNSYNNFIRRKIILIEGVGDLLAALSGGVFHDN